MRSNAQLEQHLLDDCLEGVRRLQREIGYNPTYFTRMIGDLGPREAARRLVQNAAPFDGFTTLWMDQKLEMSVEAVMLLPWYAELFDLDDLRRARQRLADYRFDVDAFLAEAVRYPPAWAAKGGAHPA